MNSLALGLVLLDGTVLSTFLPDNEKTDKISSILKCVFFKFFFFEVRIVYIYKFFIVFLN